MIPYLALAAALPASAGIAQTIAELTLASRLVEEKMAYYEEWTATGIEPVDLPASKWGEPGPGTVVQLSARRRGTI